LLLPFAACTALPSRFFAVRRAQLVLRYVQPASQPSCRWNTIDAAADDLPVPLLPALLPLLLLLMLAAGPSFRLPSSSPRLSVNQ
jgi:hypothetical protein